MSRERITFLDAMGDIDERYIEAASKAWMDRETLYSERSGRRRSAERKSRRRRRLKTVCLASAAAVLCVGGAIAAGSGKLKELFRKEFTSPQAQEQIVTGIPVEVSGPEHIPAPYYADEESMELWNARPALPDDSPLLTIEEALYDGTILYIAGTATENGAQYELNTDRLYINDEEWGPVTTASDPENPDVYSFMADLSGLNLNGSFRVTLPLSVYAADGTRYQNQELTFELDADGAAVSSYQEPTVFEHEELTLEIQEITVSATVLQIVAKYHMKDAASLKQEGPMLVPLTEDGEELSILTFHSQEEEDGTIHIESTYTGFAEQPDKLIFGTKIVPVGDYAREYPILYRDEVKLREKDE